MSLRKFMDCRKQRERSSRPSHQLKWAKLTPASKIGLQASDIIVEFEGTPVLNAQDLIQRVASTPVGQQVRLTYLRDTTNGKLEKKTASVALGERPPPNRELVTPTKAAPKETNPRGNALRLGITLAELTPQLVADQASDRRSGSVRQGDRSKRTGGRGSHSARR